MAKNLNMQLTVTADASQAKREMNSLLQSLNQLNTGLDFGKGFGTGFTKDMQKAKAQIAELQVALKSATNMDTGKLDFTKFNQQIKMSGTTLKDYAMTLNQLGPEGQQAFMQLTKSISQSEIPLRRVSNTMKEMGVTLANTIRWQISSSVLHGFMGAIQTAYGYAQDLNKSLNNIRIVTGQSTEEMAQFANYANQAAQRLSTSTTDVTNAALIYYQQGLDTEQVKERAEVTLKLANVSRQSAEEVSSQMTAIWNNFYDGSESLESYADKITALGAATASSSDEIAQGLEKFAAVSKTVGLSYDYATSALATVVAQTRQSADVVGTAFKTLFARLESLKLEGNFTDEEGNTVSLNKYSEALKQVGVNIFQANGQLKDMDVILDDLGGRWKELDKNTKVALAQTVGGMRQYNQLIALMDNYDKFQDNLKVAKGAKGKLQEQQNIYAEGWEASAKRVKAAWEDLYKTFINDDFFIELNNDLTEVLKTLNLFIDNMGGVKGLLLNISPLLMSLFGDKLQQGITNTISNIKMMLPGVRNALEKERQRTINDGLEMAKNTYGPNSTEYKAYNKEIEYQNLISKYNNQITLEQKEQLKIMHDQEMKAFDIQKAREQELRTLQEESKTMRGISAEDQKRLSDVDTGKASYNQVVGAMALSEMGYLDPRQDINANAPGAPDLQTMGGRISQAYQFASQNKDQYGFSDSLIQELEKLNTEWVEQKKVMDDTQSTEEELNNAAKNLMDNFNKLTNITGQYYQNASEAANTKLKDNFEQKGQVSVDQQRQNALDKLNATFGSERGYNKNGYDDIIKAELRAEQAIKNANADYKKQFNEMKFTGEDSKNPKVQARALQLKENAFAHVQQRIKELENALEEYKKEIKEAQKAQDNLEKSSQDLADAQTDAANKQGKNVGQQENAKADINRGEEAIDQNSNILNDAATRMQLATMKSQNLGNMVAGTAQAFMGLGAAVNQATSIQEVWGKVAEGNMSVGQALTQTVISLGGLLYSLKTGIEGVNKVLGTYTVKSIAAKALLKKSNQAITASAVEAKVAEMGLATTIKGLAAALGPAGFAFLGFTAIVSVLFAWLKSTDQAYLDLAESQNKRLEKLKEESDKNKNLKEELDILKEINKEYKEGTITEEEYWDKIQNSIDKIKEENKVLGEKLQLIKDIKAAQGLEEIIKKTSEEADQKQQLINKEIISTSKSATKLTGQGNYWTNMAKVFYDPKTAIETARGRGQEVNISSGFGLTNKAESKMLDDIDALNLGGVSTDGGVLSFDPDTMTDEDYVTLMNFLSDAVSSGKYGSKETNDLIDELLKYFPKIVENTANLTNALVENNKSRYKQFLEQDINSYKAANPEATAAQIYTFFIRLIESGKYDTYHRFSHGEGEAYGKDLLNDVVGSEGEEGYAHFYGAKQLVSNKHPEATEEDFSSFLNEYGNQIDKEKYYATITSGEEGANQIYESMKKVSAGKKSIEDFNKQLDTLNRKTQSAGIAEKERVEAINYTINNLEFGKTFDKAKGLEKFSKALGVSADKFEEAFDQAIDTYDNGTAIFIGDTNKIRQEILENLSEENTKKYQDKQESISKLDKFGYSDNLAIAEKDLGRSSQFLAEIEKIYSSVTSGEKDEKQGYSQLEDYLQKNYDYNPKEWNNDVREFGKYADKLPQYLRDFLGNLKVVTDGSTGERSLDLLYKEQVNPSTQRIENNILNLDANKKRFDDLKEWRTELEEIVNEINEPIDYNDFNAMVQDVNTQVEDLEDAYNGLGGSIEDYQKKMINATSVTAKSLGVKDEYEAFTEYLMENNEALAQNEALARQTALGSARLSQGIQELCDHFKDYNKILSDTSKEGTQEYAEAMSGVEKSLQKVFGINEDIDPKFIKKNLKDIEKLTTGDEKALLNLRTAYSKSLLENIDLSTANEDQRSALEASMKEIQASLDDGVWGKLKIGMELDDFEAGQKLQKFIIDSKITAEEATRLLNSMGFEAEPILSDPLPYTNPITGETEYKRTVLGFKGTSYVGKGKTPTPKKSSSSKGKSRSKKNKKDLKDEKERYYVISRQLQDQLDIINKLDKAKSRAWGKAKLDYIDRETEALEKELDIQKQYLKEIQDYYKLDQENLNFFGAKYDENGVVTNYDEMIEKELKRYNNAVKKYNSGKMSEAEFNKASQRYEDFEKKLKQYDDTNELYQKKLEEIQQLEYEIYDKALEKITTKVEMDIQVNDAELEKLEYDLDRIQKKAFSTAESIAKMSEQLGVNLSSQTSYDEAVNQILANHGIASINDISNLSDDTIANLGFTEDEVNTLLDYNSNLLDTQKTIDELQESIIHGMVDAFEEWNEEFDYQQDKIASNIDLLKQYQTIADLIYSNSPGVTNQFITDVMGSQYAQMVNGVEAAYARLTSQRASLEQAKAEYERLIASGASEQTLTAFRNDLRTMESEVENSQSDMLKKTEEALKQAEDIFKKAVEDMSNNFKEMVKTSDWDMTKFDRLKKLDEQYLDDYEKIYEFSKLTRDINNSIDDADTIRQKERLKEITQEIADIEASGKEVSQFEVDALRKKYELRLAEIALEDAQAAKQTVRMSRDNDGNWSYVYTADEDNVDKARQNYEDKLYEYQKLNSDFIKEQQENFLNLENQYVEEMTKIAQDSSLNEEDKERRLQETQEYYQRMAEIMSDQLGIAIDKNSELYNKDWLDYSKTTGYKISKLEDYQTKIEDTYTGVLQPNVESASDLLKQFTEATVGEGGYFPSIMNALGDFELKQEEVLNAAGTTLADYAGLVSGAMKTAEQSSKDAAESVEESSKDMRKAFDDVINKINDVDNQKLDKLRTDITTTVNKVTTLIQKYKDLSEAIKDVNKQSQNGGVNGADYGSGSGGSGGGGGGGGNNNNNGYSKDDADLLKYIKRVQSYIYTEGGGGWILSNDNVNPLLKALSLTQDDAGRLSFLNKTANNLLLSIKYNKSAIKALKNVAKEFNKYVLNNTNEKISFYDTGGYTGSWGNEGRLAMLHQKELVLNAHDTENMLNTIQMVRDIVASIDVRAAAAGAVNINNAYASAATAGPQDLNQNVHIEANFPNATDHNEIELALTNLVNRASQYVGRKNL